MVHGQGNDPSESVQPNMDASAQNLDDHDICGMVVRLS